MPISPRTPVLVGQAQILQREDDLARARGPINLMADAVRAAFEDAGSGVPTDVDALHVLRSLSTKSQNPGLAIARLLGITSKVCGYTTHGGNLPQALVNVSALDIQSGRADLVVLTGGESSRSRRRAKASGKTLDWMAEDPPHRDDPEPTNIGGDLEMLHPLEIERKVVLPIEIYPMFETALRSKNGMTIEQHRAHVGALWSRFSDVAASNPFAWTQKRLTSDEIVTPTATNRMVGYPYTKVMNSNNDVDMAAAVILTSWAAADRLGVPEEQRVVLRGWCYATDPVYVAEHDDLARSPALAAASAEALRCAGIDADDVAHLDLYSCFASSVDFARDALRIGGEDSRALTVTGGLPYSGGPASNYLTHSVSAMVERLRSDPGSYGLVTGVGMHTTKHVHAVYSTLPGPVVRPDETGVQAGLDAGHPARSITDHHTGDAVVAAYSVVHGRDGAPAWGLVVVDLPDGSRSYGRTDDVAVCAALEAEEWVGRTVTLAAEGDVNRIVS